MRFLTTRFAFLLLALGYLGTEPLLAQVGPKETADISLDYYLPEGYRYDPNVPRPEEILGFQVGEWHADYGQALRYLEALAASSERAELRVIGQTYEKRPQVVLYISSPENIRSLDSLQGSRKEFRNPNASIPYADTPLVLAAGYSVHGNEASALNASLLTAYFFTAAEEVLPELAHTIWMLDPSMNPDGSNRFATWVNSHRSYTLNGDPNQRELSEAWPGGRGNHYWFDLNRDWMLVQHPESQHRVKHFQAWLPTVFLDYHEMGKNSTYFFQPGIPSRDHPLIPKENMVLTEKIAQYHAEELDGIGSLYYSRESFDEYFFGYGSTYPDIQGSIGILFEQASSRGHLQESIYGPLPFAFTIRNQFRTSLSTFRAVTAMREELHRYQHGFYKQALQEAEADTDKAYIFGQKEDPARAHALAQMIQQHAIDVYQLNEDITVNSVSFEQEKAYIVPLNQPQYRLIKAFFEVRNEFTDSLFYDVSAWTMPMSFHVDYMALSSRIVNLANVTLLADSPTLPPGRFHEAEDPVAYSFEWHAYYAPRLTHRLMEAGFLVRLSHQPLLLSEEQALKAGAVVVSIPRGGADAQKVELERILREEALPLGIDVHAIQSGYTMGVNLGSPQIDVLQKPEVALLVGPGVNSIEAGEIWHLFDQRMHLPLTLLSTERLASADLSRYTVIALPNGNYDAVWGEREAEKLKAWTAKGHTLIARGQALQWVDKMGLAEIDFRELAPEEKEAGEARAYKDYEKNRGARLTSGTIFHAQLDLSHPLGYGYTQEEMYTFRNTNLILELPKNPYASPLRYRKNPLASGYVHPEIEKVLSESAGIVVKRLGAGRVVAFADNPNFRAVWYGTNKLFLNAVFFGQVIQSGTSDAN